MEPTWAPTLVFPPHWRASQVLYRLHACRDVNQGPVEMCTFYSQQQAQRGVKEKLFRRYTRISVTKEMLLWTLDLPQKKHPIWQQVYYYHAKYKGKTCCICGQTIVDPSWCMFCSHLKESLESIDLFIQLQ